MQPTVPTGIEAAELPITSTGTAGASTKGYSTGVTFDLATVSGGGGLTVTGNGSSTGAGSNNAGALFKRSTLSSDANIMITGVGGAGKNGKATSPLE